MDNSLKKFAWIGLGVGLLGLLVAAGLWLYRREFNTAVQAALAVGILGLALAALMNPDGLQRWLGGRQARYGSNAAVMLVAFAGIVFLLNYLVYKNPKRWDLTEDQSNTFAPQTVAAIQQLSAPVRAVGFYSTTYATARDSAQQLLERYKIESNGKFSYEFHDPISDPGLAKDFGVTRDSTLVLLMGDQRQELSFASEQEVTGALIRLANPETRVVYFVTGHGERDLRSTDKDGLAQVVQLLTKQNYDVQPLNLAVTTTVPSDAKALVLAGPLVPLSESELKLVDDYLKAGGSFIALLDPGVQTQASADQPDPLADYLNKTWGLQLSDDVVVDFNNSYPNQPLFPLNASYGFSPITDKLQNIATVYPVSRSVVISGTAQTFPNLTYVPLVKLDEQAWGETNTESLSSETGPSADEADIRGDATTPLNVAVSAEDTLSKGRLVVVGDSDFATNNVSNQGANANLFVNSVNWAALDENLINLTPKFPTQRTLILTDVLAVRLIFLTVVVVMPLAVLALGAVVWFQRRRHV
jgi:ABC-type uncharacterized transport system involved in gliding motility auxiliary subunit